MTVSQASTRTAITAGVTGHLIRIDVSVSSGPPGTTVTGVPDKALREARDRIRAAIINSGYPWPPGEITVHLSPAVPAGHGASHADLAIAAAILTASGDLPPAADHVLLLAELGLDGTVRPVRDVLPAVAAAARSGIRTVIVAAGNAAETALVPDTEVIAVADLRAAVRWLRDAPQLGPDGIAASRYRRPDQVWPPGGRTDLVVPKPAGRALEICAAGGHHLSLTGPPGSGKTMLAGLLPQLMPALEISQALEITAIHSAAGLLPSGEPLVECPPFQAPHYTASRAAVIGRTTGQIRPGAASLAHGGVLLLDDTPRFSRDVLDALRQPLATGTVTIAGGGLTVTWPARFTLVLTARPCPCPDGEPSTGCSCTVAERRRYLGRVSGPLPGRIAVKVRLPGPQIEREAARQVAEPVAAVAARVEAARARAAARLAGTPWRLSSEVPDGVLRRGWPAGPGGMTEVDHAVDAGRISTRGAAQALRVAWTIADLAGQQRPGPDECGEALSWWRGAAS